MQDSDYHALADAALSRLEDALDEAEGDFDHQLVAAGVLEVEFANGGKLIVNKQSAAREIWVAARSGGFHYRWDGAAWRDTRGGEELFCALERLLSEQAGAPVILNAH